MGHRRPSPRPLSEPIRRPWLWVTFVLLILAMAPWYLPEGETAPLVFGLPYWFVISIGATLIFAAVTSWTCVRRWNLAEPEEEGQVATGSESGEETSWTT
ncbi:hypothetical protein [Prauserella rugosa]|uniref:DUF3311 domain-containing protein n=1 Tax=Prauserella rugosa TaxID=43354 RepID=A0A660CJS1_9PSEU|nr:hypothetical protein [Prauserella rugosa]KMS82692.1 hypothetical protein ACZ91_57250 [Streptomyces regensis]TWH22127.1 hypothetical protein JD82_04001 [Prauserella rugosa]